MSMMPGHPALATQHSPWRPVQDARIGSSKQAWEAATLVIGAARFRCKTAAGLPSAPSTLTARRGYALQSAAAQRFPDMMQVAREESMSTVV